ncbi:MAG TPA: hypothetical protein VIK33_17570 [Anaerolineae bacterium]
MVEISNQAFNFIGALCGVGAIMFIVLAAAVMFNDWVSRLSGDIKDADE